MPEKKEQRFDYDSGCKLEVLDFGEDGMMFRIYDSFYDNVSAVLVPPEKLSDLVNLLSQSLSQDKLKVPKNLHHILTQMMKAKKRYSFQRGDKNVVRKGVQWLCALEREGGG